MLTARQRRSVLLLLTPTTGWLLVFFFVPLAIMAAYSFAARGTYGGVDFIYSLDNYRRALDPIFVKLLLKSCLMAVAATAVTLAMGYPLAHWISFHGGPRKGILMLLVVIPFWTNFLIRIYAWMLLLNDHGVVNSALALFGIREIRFLYNNKAVLLGLVYGYLPFMVLPIYNSLEKLDRTLLEAAHDQGATRFQALMRVTIPLAMPGIVAGCLLTFIPAVGAFVVPDLLGGPHAYAIGNLVTDQFLKARNWPFGAALSFLLILLVLAGVVLYLRMNAREEET